MQTAGQTRAAAPWSVVVGDVSENFAVKQLRIGLDVDGVLADYMAGVADIGRMLGHAMERAIHGPTTYGLVEPGWFPSMEAANAAMTAMLDHGVIGRLELLDTTAAAAVGQLRRAGHQVVVVTARDRRCETQTRDWLRRHRIDADEVLFERRKALTNCHVYIDDAPHNIAELRESGAGAVVYDAPYNRDVSGPRVHDLAGFAELVLSHRF